MYSQTVYAIQIFEKENVKSMRRKKKITLKEKNLKNSAYLLFNEILGMSFPRNA